MTTLNGFVKLHRKMIEWGWYSDCVVKDVFLHILMVATFKPTKYLGYELKPGQAVIGRKKMANELGFSEQQIRTALKKLESTGEISLLTTNKFTIATVENWEFYQCDDDCCNQQNADFINSHCDEIMNNDFHNSKKSQKSTSKSTSCDCCNFNDYKEVSTSKSTNDQPTNNQQITNKQPHLKNVKNNNNRGTFSPPTVDEVRAYCIERKNCVDPEAFIDYYTSNGWMVGKNHMKDWKAAVRTWERKDREREGNTPAPAKITF